MTTQPNQLKSQTPRTDAFEENIVTGYNDWPRFARQLERDLSEANERVAREEKAYQEVIDLLSEAKQQIHILTQTK